MSKQIETGEWEVDKNGKRYRRIGGSIEYEMEYWIGGICVPESQLDAFTKARKESEERLKQEEKEKLRAEQARPKHNCPFADGMQTLCKSDCALFRDDGCILSHITDKTPEHDTEGRRCPLSKYNCKCRQDCALYRSGCVLTTIIK